MREIKKLEKERGIIEESKLPDFRRLGEIRRRLAFLFGVILLG
jgi:hypothetical protein